MTIIPNLWLRLHFLVRNPDCDTFANDFDRIVWRDNRNQPNVNALRAVSQTQLDLVDPVKVRQNLRASARTKLTAGNRIPLTPGEFDAL